MEGGKISRDKSMPQASVALLSSKVGDNILYLSIIDTGILDCWLMKNYPK